MTLYFLSKWLMAPSAFAQDPVIESGKRLAVRTIETLINPIIGLVFAVAFCSFFLGLARYFHYQKSNSLEEEHATGLMKGSLITMVVSFIIFSALNYARLGSLVVA